MKISKLFLVYALIVLLNAIQFVCLILKAQKQVDEVDFYDEDDQSICVGVPTVSISEVIRATSTFFIPLFNVYTLYIFITDPDYVVGEIIESVIFVADTAEDEDEK